MRYLLGSCTALALAVSPYASGATLGIAGLDVRSTGVFMGGPDANASSFAVDSSVAGVVTVSFTYSNQDVDGDGTANDEFDLTLTYTGTNVGANGQGVGTGFGNLSEVTVTGSATGTATDSGDAIVFDGFTGAGIASFEFGGSAPDRFGTINGVLVDPPSAGIGGTGTTDFALVSSVFFDDAVNTGTIGSLVIREFDIQVSTSSAVIPEPASMALFGLGGLAMLTRRRR